MLIKTNISSERQKLIVYLALVVVTFAVYWQVNQYDFIHFDDNVYVKENPHVQSGITADGIRWAFTTKYFDLWHPVVWLSLMTDHQLFGLKAGGYHLTNLIFHVLSTLLLFWLFNRMTGAICNSAFVAALFALHPLHVESVAWIAERKDVLSAFFWMLTLCFYVYFTEKPALRRYLLVLFSFALALMSKPMAVSLPVILILLDFWPLRRFESNKDNLLLRQFREKIPFFILSIICVIITFSTPQNASLRTSYAPYDFSSEGFSLLTRIVNAPVAFVTYIEKTFWPHDLAIYYPFPSFIPVWQFIGASLLIIAVTLFVIEMARKMPYLFAGWMWYAISVVPVLGVVQIGGHCMADRYTYIPLIGIFIMLAWGVPALIKNEKTITNILFPSAIGVLIVMAVLSWKQCGYWKDGITLFEHALPITNGNYVTHNNLAIALTEKGRTDEAIYHYNQSIKIAPDGVPYNNLGNIYADLGQYQKAMDYYNKAISMRPDYADAYYNRALIYSKSDMYQLALDNYNKAISLKPSAQTYNNRGNIFNRLGKYKLAIEDYNNAIKLENNYPRFYINRSSAYFSLGNNESGCVDAQKACDLGSCNKLEDPKVKGLCR